MYKAVLFYFVIAAVIISVVLPTWTQPVSAAIYSSNSELMPVVQNNGPGDQKASSPTKSEAGESSKTGNKGKGRQATDTDKSEPPIPGAGGQGKPISEWGAQPQGGATGPESPPPQQPPAGPNAPLSDHFLTLKVSPDQTVGAIDVNPIPTEEITVVGSGRAGRGYSSATLKYVTPNPTVNVQITAVRKNKDWAFDHWELKHFSRERVGYRFENPTSNSYGFMIYAQTDAIAVFVPVYSLTVNCGDGGEVYLTSNKAKDSAGKPIWFVVKEHSTQTGPVREGSIVTLVPIPKDDSWVFVGWGGKEKGDVELEKGRLNLRKMDSNRTLTANFKQKVETVTPGEKKETPPGTPTNGPKPEPKPEPKAGPTPEPKAGPTPEPKIEPKAGPIPEPKTEPQPGPTPRPAPAPPPQKRLHTMASPPEGGFIDPDTGPEGKLYPTGMTVTITAAPRSGWEFSHWSGGLKSLPKLTLKTVGKVLSGEEDTLVVMASDITVIAYFKKKPTEYLLVTGVTPDGGGTINPQTKPDGDLYRENTSVTITATPAQGYHFDGFIGDTERATWIPDERKIIVPMDTDREIFAHFTPVSGVTRTPGPQLK